MLGKAKKAFASRTPISLEVVRAHMLRNSCFSSFLKLQKLVRLKTFRLENNDIELNQGNLRGKHMT